MFDLRDGRTFVPDNVQRKHVTHELKIYAGQRHKTVRARELLLHLWFCNKWQMQLDLDIALNREDVSHVDVIDVVNHKTERHYPHV